MYDMCTSDLSFWTMVSWSLPGPSCMTCVHQIFPSKLWFLGPYLVIHVWHVYIRSFLLNYGFLVSSWSFMYDMCTSDLSFWSMVSWSLPVPLCMTCVHQIFPSELWFLGLIGPSCIWHVYIRSFLLNYGFLVSTWSSMYDMCTSDLSFWTMVSWSLPASSCMTCVHQVFPSELWFLGISGLSWMTCVHQIFPSELWFLGLYLGLYVWHVYIRSFLLNCGFLVSTWSFMYDMCTSDLSFWTMVCLSTWSFIYDMCTSDLSFWTMVSWSLPGPSCMTCVHQIFPSELWFVCLPGPSCMTCVHEIFPSELWFLGLYLVLHVWHVYIRSFLLNYGFLVSASFFLYDMCTSDFSSWTMVSWSLPGLSCMICVHQIFPSELWFFGLYLILHVWHVYIRSELWFLGLYLVLHVWHVYIRSFLLNYGFLVNLLPHVWHVYIRSFLLNYGFFISTWSFMYDMCTSDLSFWTMVSWSLPASSCMTCVHQIFPSELWFLGLYLVFIYDMCTSEPFFCTMVSWSLPGPACIICVDHIFPSELWSLDILSSLCMTCVHQIFPSELWFLGHYLILHVWHVYIRSFLLNYGFLVSTLSFMYDMCTSDLSFWTMVSWSLPGPSCMTCVHQIFPSKLWFLGLYLVIHVWHVYIRSFLLNYGFLVSTWSFMYDMCTSDLSFWSMVSWSLPVPLCMTCVHQIFPSELWFLGLTGPSCIWHVYIRSFLLNYGFLVSTWSSMYDMCTSDLSFWTMVSWSLPASSCMTCVHQVFPSELWFLGISGLSWMTCVHQIFPSELWFLGLYLGLYVWHVYIRSFLLNCGFLVSTWSFMYDMCTSDLSFWTMVCLSTWSFIYDMCTSDLSFWTMVSWSLPGPSCMTCVHQIFPSELWFVCLPGPSCMTCVHQIFPSELWFLGLYLVLHVWHVYIRSFLLNYGLFVYLVLHVWHVYIRSFLLNYGFLVSIWSFMYDMCTWDLSFLNNSFLVSNWFFMYDMCTSDLSFWTMVYCSTCSFMYDMCTSDLSFWTMVSWSLPDPSSMTCVHQIFPPELWFLGLYLVLNVWHVYIRSFLLNYGFLVSTSFLLYDMCTSDLNYSFLVYLVLHVWHVYIRSFLLNYGFLVSTWPFMYDMCTSDLSFWTMVSWSTWFFMYDMCTSDLSFWTMVSWSTWSFMYDMCTWDLSFWTMVSWSLPASSCMTCVHQIFPS